MSEYRITDGSSFKQAMAAIQEKLNTKVERIHSNVYREMVNCGVDCLSASVPRAPVESGYLRSSGYVTTNGEKVAKGAEDGSVSKHESAAPECERLQVEVGFSAPYAHRQHEDLNMRHDRTDGYRRSDGTTVNMVAGGQAKYLESVVVENIDSWKQRIAEAAKRGLSE